MGGPRLDPKAEKLIVELWMNLYKKNKKEPSANTVLAACQRYLSTNKIKNINLPKIRKVQDILAEARLNNEGLPPYEKKYQEPWSMATLNEYPIPSDDISIVMQAWRYSIIYKEPFTIRQAKWISRLNRIPFLKNSMMKLWLMAYEYAKKEESSLISKKDFNTFDSDLRIIFSGPEYMTIWKNQYGDDPFPNPYFTAIPYAEDGGVMEEVLHPVDYYNALYNDTIQNDRDIELFKLISKIPSFENMDFYSMEMMVLYLIWVTEIKNKPEWQQITANQALEIIKLLREWIIELQSIKYSLKEDTDINAIKLINNNVVFDSEFPMPEKVLKTLDEYAKKESK